MNIRPLIDALDGFCLECTHVESECDRCTVLAFHEWLYRQEEAWKKENRKEA